MGVRCKVCADKAAKTVIDEDLERGLTATFIAQTMKLRGFDVSADIINRHNKHRERPVAEEGVKATQKDLAILIRDKAARVIESTPDDELFLKQNDNLLKHGLASQKILDNRERRKTDAVNVLLEFARLFGPRPIAAQLEDGNTIDGEAVEVG